MLYFVYIVNMRSKKNKIGLNWSEIIIRNKDKNKTNF